MASPVDWNSRFGAVCASPARRRYSEFSAGRFGAPSIDGGTVRLPRPIGQSRPLDMILTGRPVRVEEACGGSLINHLIGANRPKRPVDNPPMRSHPNRKSTLPIHHIL